MTNTHADRISLNLPTEILVLIFNEACHISPSFCLSLSQISTWARRLALPHLYAGVTVTKLPIAYSLPKILSNPAAVLSDPVFIPASHVRSLWIGPASKKTVEIFTICQNLTHVALQEDNFYWLAHASTQITANSEQTNATIRAKPDFDLFILNVRKSFWHGKQLIQPPPACTPPLFEKIRRLWIGKTQAYGSSALYLQHFTRLTHLAVPYHNSSIQRLSSLLRLVEYPNIESFVLVLLTDLLTEEEYDEGLSWVIVTRLHQPKLFALPLQHAHMHTHWEEGIRLGQSVWEKAVMFTNFLDISSSNPIGIQTDDFGG